MKAIAIEKHGSSEVVKLVDLPEPRPEAGEVLIEVRASALNHLDIWVRIGRPGYEIPMPHILGSDVAGVVKEVGGGVDPGWIGKEVVVNPGISCNSCPWCRKGEQSECPHFGILGFTRPGTHAQYVAVPERCLAAKPKHLDWEHAASLSLAHLTAFRMLFSRARVSPGETVLIHGIGGGVALAALQLAKAAGARTIVTSSSEEKLKKAKQLGADFCINRLESRDLAEAILGAAPSGVDVIIDSVGAATCDTNLKVVRKGGRIALCGVTGGKEATVNLQRIYWNQVSILGSTMGSDNEYRLMLSLVETQRIVPVLDSVFPLSEGRKAHEKLEKGEQFGKIVLTP